MRIDDILTSVTGSAVDTSSGKPVWSMNFAVKELSTRQPTCTLTHWAGCYPKDVFQTDQLVIVVRIFQEHTGLWKKWSMIFYNAIERGVWNKLRDALASYLQLWNTDPLTDWQGKIPGDAIASKNNHLWLGSYINWKRFLTARGLKSGRMRQSVCGNCCRILKLVKRTSLCPPLASPAIVYTSKSRRHPASW